jgi:hypothetical protein
MAAQAGPRLMYKHLIGAIGLFCFVGLSSGCTDNSSPDASQTTNTLPENRTPQIDADPTPDTGTGGESQTKAPEGTVNGAPAGQ